MFSQILHTFHQLHHLFYTQYKHDPKFIINLKFIQILFIKIFKYIIIIPIHILNTHLNIFCIFNLQNIKHLDIYQYKFVINCKKIRAYTLCIIFHHIFYTKINILNNVILFNKINQNIFINIFLPKKQIYQCIINKWSNRYKLCNFLDISYIFDFN